MHPIASLFTYYDEVRNNLSKDIGTIFDYTKEENNGLKILAGIMAGGRHKGLSSIHIYESIVTYLCIHPTVESIQGINLGLGIDQLCEPRGCVLCLQITPGLTFDNFIIVKTNVSGEHLKIYSVCGLNAQARHLTDVYIDYKSNSEDIAADIRRLNAVVIEEASCMIP